MAAHGSCFEHAFRLQEEAPPLPVESAFNGLGLYKAAALRGAASRCAYLGLTQGHAVSEHVPFHLCLGSHAHARLTIMPGLTTHCASPKIEKAPRRFVTRLSVLLDRSSRPGGEAVPEGAHARQGHVHVV